MMPLFVGKPRSGHLLAGSDGDDGDNNDNGDNIMMTVMNDVNANGDDISMTMMMTLFVGKPRSGHLLVGSAAAAVRKSAPQSPGLLHLAAVSRVVVVNILYVLLYMYLYV